MTHQNVNLEEHLFKTALADVRVVSRLMQQFLPEGVQAALDMRTLKQLPNSFVEQEFATALSDRIFSVKMKGRAAYICWVCVDQLIPDRLLPALMLCYTLHVQEQHHKQYPKQKRPFIYALVTCNEQRQFQNTADINEADRFVKFYHSADCFEIKESSRY